MEDEKQRWGKEAKAQSMDFVLEVFSEVEMVVDDIWMRGDTNLSMNCRIISCMGAINNKCVDYYDLDLHRMARSTLVTEGSEHEHEGPVTSVKS